MAKSKQMSDEESNGLLASSLRLVVHQKLDLTKSDQKKLRATIAFSQNGQSPVANRIKNGSIDQLITEIEHQQQMLKLNQFQKLVEEWKIDTLYI